jgi:hypothetical protein
MTEGTERLTVVLADGRSVPVLGFRLDQIEVPVAVWHGERRTADRLAGVSRARSRHCHHSRASVRA